MSATLSHALRWWSRERADEPALVLDDDTVTYAELEGWSSRVGRLLIEMGVQPGDPVGVIGENSLEWAAVAMAVVKVGGILVPLNQRFVARELSSVLVQVGARLVIGEPQFRAGVDDADIEMVDIAEVTPLRAGGLEDVRRDRDPAEPLIVLFTSGTTGLSKGVVYTNISLLGTIAEWMLMEKSMRPGVRTLLVLPLAFAPGVVWGLMRTVFLGGMLAFQRTFDPERAVEALLRHRIQVLYGAPLVHERISRAAAFESARFPDLVTATTAGARVPEDLLKRWHQKGVAIRQGYGLTEAGGHVTVTRPEDAVDHPGTCGRGGIFSEFRIVRPDGSECEPDEPGEVYVRGPGRMAEYWNEPELTAQVLVDGWIRTGDLGLRTSDGRFQFVDRIKDIIISGGINISPMEIEVVISATPGVAEVVVLAAPDPKFGETPAAIVVPEPAAPATVSDVVVRCNRELADYKVPRYVVLRDKPFPRLPTGKIAKAAVRGEYRDIPDHHPRVR